MRFDFDKLTERRNSFSMKWDVGENELPMWVADMDFETAPVIMDAIRRKVDGAIFGYTTVPDEYYKAVSGWWAKRYDFTIETDWIIFADGVVPSISSIVRKCTGIGENVLIQPPVYNIFTNSILNNGRHLIENNLVYRNGAYEIDFEDLERKLADPQTTMMILCNPHNPVGKVWDNVTLAKIGELCAQYHVLVVSDEIHCDLTYPGIEYVPFASVSEVCAQNSITCISPTKTFNLAGLQTASVVVPNATLRHRVNRGLNTDEIAEPNAFAMEATIAAYTQGDEWLDAARDYIMQNGNMVRDFIQSNIPQLKVVASDATYLLWIDCANITDDSTKLRRFIRKETGLYLSDGAVYGGNGKLFLRMNIACPKARVQDGLNRLKQAIQKFTAV